MACRSDAAPLAAQSPGVPPARELARPCTGPGVAAAVAPQPLAIDGTSTYFYKRVNGVELRAHVLAPERRSTARVPAAAFFFGGGGWMWGSDPQCCPLRGVGVARCD